VLPLDHGPPMGPDDEMRAPLVETVWVEPYPDETMGIAEGLAAPAARFEQREAIELAFIAALQHLPANQRAALILREVLGFSAREVAETLETSVAAINSALQRARKTVEERAPERSQQQTLRAMGGDGVREVVQAYLDAWDRNDVEAVVAQLAADATFSMPPAPYWFQGREALLGWMPEGPLTGEWRWRHLPTTANGQPALGFYCWDEGEKTHLAFALNVLGFRDGRIAEVTAFIARATEDPDPEAYVRWPEQPFEPRKLEHFFTRFGLPDRVD
jgi:RNA polymerase sigma-70 factor, ECF subfamily